MGFYTKGQFLQLPNKRVVDDLLEREGAPTEESFTPFDGLNHLIAEQMKGSRYSVLCDVDLIKRNVVEFHVTRSNGNLEDTDLGDLEESNEVKSYRLEDIKEEQMVKFIISCLIGVKKNKNTARTVVKESEMIQPLLVDSESGEVNSLSDLYVSEDDSVIDYSDRNSIKEKIPYLLKKLQDGSIKYGVSLLSLFIAKDAIFNNIKSTDPNKIKPRDLLKFPIYNVSRTGELLGTMDPETANNTPKFRDAKDLVIGVNLQDPYYRAGTELMSKAAVLGHRLANEDPRDYPPQYINRLMCSYIMSNMEVYADIAPSLDSNIMKILEEGGIFSTPVDLESVHVAVHPISRLRTMARQKIELVPNLMNILRDCNNDLSLSDPIRLINQFLELYRILYPNSKSIEAKCVSDCNSTNMVLCDSCDQPLIFCCSAFVVGFNDTPGFTVPYFMVTTDGYFIQVDDTLDRVTYSTVDSVLAYYGTKNDNLLFRDVVCI